ncbi:MAG: TlpA family protein disulfide reductase [Acidobacteria bacterium]|nr:TlpA family protein disulfide reductase [Acidobacteriota bacterium]
MRRYPAIFVDDVLVATPKDFGFYGKGEGAGDGRYTPFQSAESHERFRNDLSKMIDLILSGRKAEARARAPQTTEAALPALPEFSVTDLDGHALARADLAGRAVLVEFWATWCPPCRGTLAWLGDLKKKYGDRLAIVALAVQSDEADVRKLAGDLKLPLSWSMATPDLARSFGDITSVPTMFLFDRSGKAAGAFYGAPPTLHHDAESRIASIAG